MATEGDPPEPPLAMRGLWEMSVIPIVEHDRATPTSEQCAAVDRLAGELARDNPTLAVPEEFRPLVPETLDDMATLHLDDFSEIPLLDQSHEVWHLQQRARLRAGDGDFVVCLRRPWTATRNTAAITWAWVPRGGSIRRRRGPALQGWRWPAGRTARRDTKSFTNYDVANSLRYTRTWGLSRSGNWRDCSSERAAGRCG